MKKIFALLLAVLIVSSFSVTALAAPVDEATIDTSRTGTLDIGLSMLALCVAGILVLTRKNRKKAENT